MAARNMTNQIDANILNSLKKCIHKCPICDSKDFKVHSILYFAQIPYTQTDKVLEFRNLILRREWENILKINLGKPSEDLLLLKLLQCPSGKMLFLEIFSPFELFQPDKVEQIIFLEEDEQLLLEKLTESKNWYRFD